MRGMEGLSLRLSQTKIHAGYLVGLMCTAFVLSENSSYGFQAVF